MSRIENLVLAVLFLGACVYIDVTNRRIRTLESENKGWEIVADMIGNSAYWAESHVRQLEKDWPSAQIQQLQQNVGNLQQRTGKLEESGCDCGCKKTSLIPRDAKIVSVVIHKGEARFTWREADGEHTLTIPESELDRVAVVDADE